MKPILLTIEGLHSFREKQTIDFEQLSGAGVFGIFGPTGSGKSTILDAITLALFGTVGRAKNRTQGILNHAENSLSVSFQFEIGTGTDRKTYRIDRRYERNTETTVKNKYSRISELDANQEELVVLANKDGEVTELVQAILGLKLEDFTRAVVLPQGKFADFLQLEGKKRREMLQRLFSLERFGFHLSKRLNEKHQHTKQSLDVIVAEQNGMGDCSKEALEHAEQLLNEAIKNEQQAIRAHDNSLKQYESAKRIVEWQEQLNETNRRLEQHAAAEQDMQRLKVNIALSEKAEKVLPFVTRLEDAKREEQHYQEIRMGLERAAASLRVETETAKAHYELAQREQKEKSPELIKRQTQLEVALGLEQELEILGRETENLQSEYDQKQQEHTQILTDIHRLTELQQTIEHDLQEQKDKIQQNTVTPEFRALVQQTISKQDAYQNAVKELRDKQSEEKRRAQECKDAQTQVQTYRDQHASFVSQLQVLEQKQQELQSKPPTSEDQLSKDEGRLSVGKSKAEMMLQLETDNNSDRDQIALLEMELQTLATNLQATTCELEQSDEHLRMLRLQYQEAVRQDKRAMAAALAADLHAGEACPVCGSMDHPHPVSIENLSNQDTPELGQLELAIQKVEFHVKELTDQETNQKMDIRIKQEKISGIRQRIDSRLEQMNNLRMQMQDVLLTQLAEDTAQQILDRIAGEFRQLEHKRTEWTAWKQTIESLQKQIEDVKQEMISCASQLAGFEQKSESAQCEHKAALQVLKEKEQQLMSAEQSLQESLSSIGFDTVAAAVQDMQSKDKCIADALKRDKELQDRFNNIKSEMQDKNRYESNLRVELAELAKSLENSRKTIADKQVKWREITAGKSAEELRQQVMLELDRLVENEAATLRTFEQKSNQLAETERQLTQAHTRCEEITNRLDRIEQELKVKMHQENFTTTEEIKDAVLPPEELESFKQQVLEHEDLGKALQTEQEKLKKNLDGQYISEEQWTQIQEQLQTSERQKQEAIGICGAAKVEYNNLQEKHARWAALDSQRKHLEEQFKYLEQLKTLFRGDRFVEFLAQEQLDFVAKQASNRLKSLTRNRYALEIGDDGGFIMRDDANGGAKRPVTSLSGGETFLTSLALALSLSTQIQLRGRYPLEFFFLDEGFGTLDSELLDVVMSTLEQLRLENMTIGIISHVPELQQRMHRRLIVEPAEAAGRGSRVRIERM